MTYPAAPFLATKLRALDAELDVTLPRVRGQTDPEALHDLRVALRRLRTILRCARPVYGRFHADAVRGAFTEAQRATGVLRDAEVLGETLAELEVKDPAFILWRDQRRARERGLRRAVIAELATGHMEQARRLLDAIVTLPVEPGRDPQLTRFAQKCVERAEREVAERADAPTSDGAALHELRIAYKHVRYSIEIFAEALPPIITEKLKRAVQFQKRLGELHDVDVALEVVRRARGLPPVTRARVLRALRSLRSARMAKYLQLRDPISPPGATRSGKSRPSSPPHPAPAGRRGPSAPS